MELKKIAIILASGRGTRFKNELPKQFSKLAGKMIFEHTVDVFEKNPNIDEIIIVSSPDYTEIIREKVIKNYWHKVTKILKGGETRQESSYIGINSIEYNEAFVLIHDAVRPFVSHEIINKVIEALKEHKAVDVAIPSADTIIKIDDNLFIKDIPERKYYWRGQTPQGFWLPTIKKAHDLAKNDKFTTVTDDCGLVLKYNLANVFVVNGSEDNIKITFPIDIYIADKIFQLKNCMLTPDNRSNYQFLKEKTIVVFGASSGIGEAIVNLAKKEKSKIYGFSKSSGVDISVYEDVENALSNVYSKEGKIDAIIVTAGILKTGLLASLNNADILSQIETNYIGSINVAKASFKYLSQSKGHLVLFTSSSYTRGRALYSIYSSTKAAIVNLAQALSEEWYEFNIKVNAICPERTATPMRFKNFGKEPINTLLSPEIVAETTIKLLNSDITGEVIEVRKK